MRHGPSQVTWGFLVLVSAIGFGLLPLFVLDLVRAGLPPEEIGLGRFAATALIALPFILRSPGSLTLLPVGFVAGLFMAAGFYGTVESLRLVGAVRAGIILMMYPLASLLLVWAMRKRDPGPRTILAVVLVLGAGWLLTTTGLFDELAPVDLALLALGPVGFGSAVAINACWLGRLSPMARLSTASLGAVAAFIGMQVGLSLDVVMPQPATWSPLAGLAFVTSLLPSLIYLIAAPRIGPVKTIVAGSVELPVMIAVGVFVFAETLTEVEAIAAGLVLLAGWLAAFSGQLRGRPPGS